MLNVVIKLSIIVKPIPLRSAPPVVNIGLLACSMFSIPTGGDDCTVQRIKGHQQR